MIRRPPNLAVRGGAIAFVAVALAAVAVACASFIGAFAARPAVPGSPGSSSARGSLAATGPTGSLPSAPPGSAAQSSDGLPAGPGQTGGPERTPRPAGTAVWVLAGRPNDTLLFEAGAGAQRVLPLPFLDVWWASGDAERGFVLTVGRDGKLVSSDPVPVDRQPIWHDLVLRNRGARLANPPAFATLSPDGSRVAAVAGDAASGALDAQLVIADRATGGTDVIDLGARADGRAASWLGDDRVGVPVLDASDTPEVVVVDVPSNATPSVIRRARTDAGSLAISVDARTIAYQPRVSGRLRVGPFGDVVAGRTLIGASREIAATAGDGRLASQLLLDPAGRHLAVCWADVGGDPAAVAIYALRDGRWSAGIEEQLPAGTTRAVLAGFAP